MKFTINREILLEAVIQVARGISVKTPMPVLSGIKLELSEQILILTATNREISVQVTIPASADLTIEQTGVCVVPGKYFIEIVKKIEEATVEFTLFEGTTIKVVSQKSNFTLVSLEAKLFPALNFEPLGEEIAFNCTALKKIIHQTTFAAGTSEARITLTGVCFEINNDMLKVTATDSYRLARKITSLEKTSKNFKIIIPSKALEDLSKILNDDHDQVKMFIETNKALFKYKNVCFMTRLIEGSFPDTNSLFPKEYNTEITFNKAALLAAIDRTTLFSNFDSTSIIRFNIQSDKIIKVASNSTEIGKVVDEIIPINALNLVAFQTAFNAKYMSDALKAFESTNITLKFTGEIKPFVIEGEKDKDLIQLILPVRVF